MFEQLLQDGITEQKQQQVTLINTVGSKTLSSEQTSRLVQKEDYFILPKYLHATADDKLGLDLSREKLIFEIFEDVLHFALGWNRF